MISRWPFNSAVVGNAFMCNRRSQTAQYEFRVTDQYVWISNASEKSWSTGTFTTTIPYCRLQSFQANTFSDPIVAIFGLENDEGSPKIMKQVP